jgi:hypothetical protein
MNPDEPAIEVDMDGDLAFIARTLLHLERDVAATTDTLALAKSAHTTAVVRRDGLIEKMQSRALEYVEQNARGKARNAELNLKEAHRPEINVRFSSRTMQDKIEVIDADALLGYFTRDQLESGVAPYTIIPPVAETIRLDKGALNKLVKQNPSLPGIKVTEQAPRASLKEV